MKRLVGALAIVALAVVGLSALADLTQNRPDARVRGTSTTLTFGVSANDYPRGEPAAARALWTVCSATIGGEVTEPVATGDHWRVRISPAIGEHGENRLLGCMEDLTIDRIIGNVVSLRSA